MLALHAQQGERESGEEEMAEEIAVLDAEIDRTVYELYGLTEEEIEIVEASVGG